MALSFEDARRPRARVAGILCGLLFLCLGCAAIPDIRHKPKFHNPFPELSRVAILPFRNQSEEPTLSGARVSLAYYNELQSVPGFEVLPLGVVEQALMVYEQQKLGRPIATADDFQQFAQFLGVDAVLQGSVTDYTPYYPPRMTLKVNWYAANPGLHPIPVGYGLPWGTKEEKKIPDWIRLESERALAREQMATQTPRASDETPPEPELQAPQNRPPDEQLNAPNKQPVPLPQTESELPAPAPNLKNNEEVETLAKRDKSIVSLVQHASWEETSSDAFEEPARMPAKIRSLESQGILMPQPDGSFQVVESNEEALAGETESNDAIGSGVASRNEGNPPNWPDPRGFIPRRPTSEPAPFMPQYEPVISHMKAYNGNDEDFTQSLQEYFYFRDDRRFGGWQSYLQRSEDFIRFCCHQHINETLSSRGGQLESRLNVRWPVYRYER
ncbi:MAG: hypothetical protein MUD03_10805 [Pirellula sp.]|jgi:hypothetical protein|nr:hypothetical protein [Pirellula sp.]